MGEGEERWGEGRTEKKEKPREKRVLNNLRGRVTGKEVGNW